MKKDYNRPPRAEVSIKSLTTYRQKISNGPLFVSPYDEGSPNYEDIGGIPYEGGAHVLDRGTSP